MICFHFKHIVLTMVNFEFFCGFLQVCVCLRGWVNRGDGMLCNTWKFPSANSGWCQCVQLCVNTEIPFIHFFFLKAPNVQVYLMEHPPTSFSDQSGKCKTFVVTVNLIWNLKIDSYAFPNFLFSFRLLLVVFTSLFFSSFFYCNPAEPCLIIHSDTEHPNGRFLLISSLIFPLFSLVSLSSSLTWLLSAELIC